MASEAVLGMDIDEVHRIVARLLTVPVAAALRPRGCSGATTWMWCGEGARGAAAPSGAVLPLEHLRWFSLEEERVMQ